MEILNSILLLIITGVLSTLGIWLKNFVKKSLNERDIISWKVTSIDHGCSHSIGESYIKARDTKWEDLIEEDKLKNKRR